MEKNGFENFGFQKKLKISIFSIEKSVFWSKNFTSKNQFFYWNKSFFENQNFQNHFSPWWKNIFWWDFFKTSSPVPGESFWSNFSTIPWLQTSPPKKVLFFSTNVTSAYLTWWNALTCQDFSSIRTFRVGSKTVWILMLVFCCDIPDHSA